jgi:choice-of-anchor A domain-containing protein
VDSGWSVFVGKDFATGGNVAELEGRAFVRGNFTAGKSGYVIGRAGAGSGVFPPADVPTLVVGGNILGTGSFNTHGFVPIQVGSNIASTVSIIDRGAIITGGVDYATADALISDLHAKSQYWGSLSNTVGGTMVSQWGGLYITADGANGNPKTWVFNLANDLTSAYWGVVFSGFEDGDTILVNCKKTGTSDTSFVLGVNSYSINGVNQNSAFGPKLLWNFPDAKTISLSGYAAFQGSVLVGNPESVTTVSVPGQDGRFATCGTLVHNGTQGCEFHNYPFTGTLPDLPVYTISGSVKIDADRTKTVTEPDKPLGGTTVALYTDPDGDGDPSDGALVQTAATESNGAYVFSSLVSGNYIVVSVSSSGTLSGAVPVTLEDGDSTDNDFLAAIDPSGFLYDTADGHIVSGGTITVSGTGAEIILDGCAGEYSFVSTNPAATTYTMTVTPPAGYVLDPARLAQSGAFDPSGYTNPVVMGSGLSATNSSVLADRSAAANTYYLSFVLESGDPAILFNNIPLARTVALGDRVWEDTNGNGMQDAGEPGMTNVTVRLLDGSSNLVATTVTDSSGTYLFANLPPATYQVAFVAPSRYVFTVRDAANAGDSADSDVNPATGKTVPVALQAGETNLTVDAGLYVPAVVYGYLFNDNDNNLVNGAGDSGISGALVRLTVGGVVVASTTTGTQGLYRFENVPAGTVSILVSRVSSTLVDVPTGEPAASNPARNRALPDQAGQDAYIVCNVVSGYGVLDSVPGEPLNFGFKIATLSTALDVSVYASGNGAVTIELWTENESGYGDIVVYAWIGGVWTEVGRVPGSQVVGEGSNKYVIQACGLSAGNSYIFRVVDEAGHVHDSGTSVSVKDVRMNGLRFEMDTAVLTFNTEYERRYAVMVSDDLGAPADEWTAEYVSIQKSGVWSSYSNQPFVAGAGKQTVLRVPVNRQKAFFKIVMLED